MKQLLILLFVATVIYADEELTQRIDNVVEIISQKRDTISQKDAFSVKDPFYRSVKAVPGKRSYSATAATPNYKKIRFTLTAIVNDRAKVNNRWIKNGDAISGYRVTNINRKSVTLRYGNSYTRTLYLNQSNNTILNKGDSDEK